jgi:ketosteroid isomerase-like protein
MSRFTKPIISVQDVIQSLHKAIYYQDIELILKLWLDEDNISYIDVNGKISKGVAQIKSAFDEIQQENVIPLFHEILNTNVHSLIGGALVETIEAIKYNPAENKADYYIHASYILLQTHVGWRFLRVHVSKANNQDVSYDKCLDANSNAIKIGLH